MQAATCNLGLQATYSEPSYFTSHFKNLHLNKMISIISIDNLEPFSLFWVTRLILEDKFLSLSGRAFVPIVPSVRSPMIISPVLTLWNLFQTKWKVIWAVFGDLLSINQIWQNQEVFQNLGTMSRFLGNPLPQVSLIFIHI